MPGKFHIKPARRTAGVSLLELCVVLGVMLVVAASALPTMMTAVQQYRLRTAAKDVAAMLQRSRMNCVRDNRHHTVQERQVAQAGMTYSQLFLDRNANGSYDGAEPVVQLPLGVRFNSASAPALSTATLGYTPQPSSTALSFNGMGLPCVMRNGICTNWDANGNAVGVVYFLQDSRHASSAWAAVAVTPAGRARTWLWSAGSSQWVAQ
ncbi:MAG: Tfp pilus assembly protein FimT/FimU [Chlamydiota bacterium]